VTEHEIDCPFCGEAITVLIDPTDETQDYIEDCQVCCKPIHFTVRSSDGEVVSVEVSRE
jgi:hypothetical protein